MQSQCLISGYHYSCHFCLKKGQTAEERDDINNLEVNERNNGYKGENIQINNILREINYLGYCTQERTHTYFSKKCTQRINTVKRKNKKDFKLSGKLMMEKYI